MTGPTANLLESSRARLACAAIVFFVALALYGLTLAPTVTLVDSGELIVAARTLGVAHPPGFPLYTMLAHAATLVPIGSVAARVNFASAIFAALAAATLTFVVAEALLIASRFGSRKAEPVKKSRRGKKKKHAQSSKLESKQSAKIETSREEHSQSRSLVALVPCLAAGLLFAFSRTLWAYATIAEVYTLNALLILVIFLLMFRWRRSRNEEKERRGEEVKGRRGQTERGINAARYEGDAPTPNQLTTHPFTPSPLLPHSPSRLLYIAALVFGLALGVHHVTVGLMLPALAFLVYATEGIKFFTSRRLLYAALCAFAGLGVYVYLPLAASGSPAMNWGDPRTLERFWWHVTGWQYQVFFTPSIETMAGQVPEFFRFLLREFGPVWMPVGLAMALVGFVAAFKRDRTIFWFLILVIFGDLVYALNYDIAEDKDAYYLPAFIALAIAAAFGAEWIMKSAKASRLPAVASRYVSIALVLVVPVVALAGNLPFNNRSRYLIAKDYVENVFKTVEPNALLLTGDWQLYSPMFYLQQIEMERADVVAIDLKLLRRSWYYDYLRHAYPQLMEASAEKVAAFLEDLTRWERNPGVYARDLALTQRINSRFYEMILNFISKHIQSGPVYVTQDVAKDFRGQDAELAKQLDAGYGLVPQGLVFQVFADKVFRQPVEPQLTMRGLADATIRFEKDDTVMLKVLPVYWAMLYYRGVYLAQHARHERAIEAFRQALELAPDNPQIKQSLNASLSAFGGAGLPGKN